MKDKAFERGNHGHRKLLALAIQDYLNQPGATLSGKGGKSLESKLQGMGVGISRQVLTRLANMNVESTPGDEYPSQAIAAKCAEGLAQLGFWPAGRDMERCLRRVPAFYNGFQIAAVDLLKEICKAVDPEQGFVSYQYSSVHPENILIGRFTFGPLTPWHYLDATNTIEKTCSTAPAITYEGVAWSDNLQNLYVQMRVPGYDFPNFILLNDIVRDRNDHRRIVALNGTGLGAGRQHNRHLTSISLSAEPYPEDDSFISPQAQNRMPDHVRKHMTQPLAFGHTNARA